MAPSSVVDVSSTGSSENTGSQQTQPTRLRSPIHGYTRPPYDKEPKFDSKNRKFLYCNQCNGFSAVSTTNVKKHLEKHHGINVDFKPSRTKQEALAELQKLWKQAVEEFGSDEVDATIHSNGLNKEVVQQALLNLIVVGNLPFRIVEWKEFHVFCQALNPKSSNSVTTTHSEVSRLIGESFPVQKDIVRRRVQSALTSIHLSVDIWTAPNNHLLLAVCSHFMDSQESRMKALLALRPVPGHSGPEQWSVLLPVLEEYGIVRKVGAIVADNSTTNDTLCHSIQDHLAENEGIQWDPVQQRIRCHGHTINLAVQDFLFKDIFTQEELRSYDQNEANGEERSREQQIQQEEAFRKMGSLGKLHNVVVHFRSSAGRTKAFVALVGRRVPLDNRTRWNSWYNMLSVALDHESGVDNYIKSHFDTLEKDYISPQDWKCLRSICTFLKPFYRATIAAQGDHSTLDQVLFTMDVLIKHMENFLV